MGSGSFEDPFYGMSDQDLSNLDSAMGGGGSINAFDYDPAVDVPMNDFYYEPAADIPGSMEFLGLDEQYTTALSANGGNDIAAQQAAVGASFITNPDGTMSIGIGTSKIPINVKSEEEASMIKTLLGNSGTFTALATILAGVMTKTSVDATNRMTAEFKQKDLDQDQAQFEAAMGLEQEKLGLAAEELAAGSGASTSHVSITPAPSSKKRK